MLWRIYESRASWDRTNGSATFLWTTQEYFWVHRWKEEGLGGLIKRACAWNLSAGLVGFTFLLACFRFALISTPSCICRPITALRLFFRISSCGKIRPPPRAPPPFSSACPTALWHRPAHSSKPLKLAHSRLWCGWSPIWSWMTISKATACRKCVPFAGWSWEARFIASWPVPGLSSRLPEFSVPPRPWDGRIAAFRKSISVAATCFIQVFTVVS